MTEVKKAITINELTKAAALGAKLERARLVLTKTCGASKISVTGVGFSHGSGNPVWPDGDYRNEKIAGMIQKVFIDLMQAEVAELEDKLTAMGVDVGPQCNVGAAWLLEYFPDELAGTAPPAGRLLEPGALTMNPTGRVFAVDN